MAYALGLLGLVAGVVMAFVLPAVGSDGWSADAKSAESVASDFVTSFNTYSADDLDDYRARVGELVTDEFEQTFLDQLDEAEEGLVASQVSFSGVVVTSTGVTQMDADSAAVVVTFTFVVDTAATDPSTVASRVIVDLARSGSSWVASDLAEIPQVEASVGAPTDGSGATPSPEVTP
ncbi:MAG: hypothetical protein P1U38_06950 [Aeromicrobium sp.]|uniref:hypothetical protein n=1 Tax=Aeromicrobium sp. TaxID=1871063 RepID=UPI0025C141A8|nr:hypothetical protein [Aeromicrobium sp.]MCK5891361.1 hypothetical protein [Aeromicrobium sp.]MDF1704493.1 hypothetical protein [Aeromicrobium sp.]